MRARRLLRVGLLLLAAAGSPGAAVAAAAAAVAGTWSATRTVGDQRRDVFALTLLERHGWLCGRVMGTSHGALLIDLSHVVGRLRGEAEVRRDGAALRWRITRPLDTSDLWRTARLVAHKPNAEDVADVYRW